MGGPPAETHPHAVGLRFKACRDSRTVESNLNTVIEFTQNHALPHPPKRRRRKEERAWSS